MWFCVQSNRSPSGQCGQSWPPIISKQHRPASLCHCCSNGSPSPRPESSWWWVAVNSCRGPDWLDRRRTLGLCRTASRPPETVQTLYSHYCKEIENHHDMMTILDITSTIMLMMRTCFVIAHNTARCHGTGVNKSGNVYGHVFCLFFCVLWG